MFRRKGKKDFCEGSLVHFLFMILSTDMMEITQKLNLLTSATTSICLLMSNTDLDVLRQHLVRFIAENSNCPSSVHILALLGLYQLIAWCVMLEYNIITNKPESLFLYW